jgi:hypothetical protein
MKLLQYLKEEYIGRYKDWEVFVNPTPKELRTYPNVRFIADNKHKNFFMSYGLVYHEYMVRYLRDTGYGLFDSDCFMGQGIIQNGKINLEGYSWDWGAPKDLREFKWAAKYFTKPEMFDNERYILRNPK